MIPNRHPIGEQICPHCTSDVTAAFAKGENKCPFCGARLGNRLVNGVFRTGLWILFWLLFLGTPGYYLFALKTNAVPDFRPLLIGIVGSGTVLSAFFSRSVVAIIPWAILFTIGVGVVYLGILFVGCLVLMTQKH
jgi:hypothetical protein